MKNSALELPNGKNTIFKNIKKIFLPVLTLTLLFTLSFFLNNATDSILYTPSESTVSNDSRPGVDIQIGNQPRAIPDNEENNETSATLMESSSANSSTSVGLEQRCNIFNGDWVPFPEGPYYTNETKCVIDDRQNCMKFGRPDIEFLKWRWKPDECELPLFDGVRFLELVRGKTLAFVGDSLARNQMQSLVCLLAKAADPIDVSYIADTRFRRWFYADYNFTIEALWSPQLVRAYEADPTGYSRNSIMKLHLDEPDEAWSTQIEHADIVIISAGQWFFRPFIYYEEGQIVGCVMCNDKNITEGTIYDGYRKAFRTAFKTLLSLQNFKGLTFLRTFSPAHFENGDWDKGGNCVRTQPFTREEMKLEGYILEFHSIQVEEFKAAEREGYRKGLKFRLLDTSGAMILRPDGHPNHYGHWPSENKTLADCVHWCMPGPVETWNEFLLEMLKKEGEGFGDTTPQKNSQEVSPKSIIS